MLVFYEQFKQSRGGRIRTYDLHIPNVARYRATLHPELFYFKLLTKFSLLTVIPLGFEPRTHTLKVYCSTS